jgi:hypothetical protein
MAEYPNMSIIIVTHAVDEKQMQEINSVLSKHPFLIIFMVKLQIEE